MSAACPHPETVVVEEFDRIDFDRDGGPRRHYETVRVLVCGACEAEMTLREPKP